MEKVNVSQYERWMDVFSLCGIIDIAHRIIGLSLQKIRSCQNDGNNKIKKVSLWEKVFESIHKNDELSKRWLNEITECQIILSNIELIAAVCDKLFFDNPSKLIPAFSSFVASMKNVLSETKPNWESELQESFIPMVSSVIKHAFLYPTVSKEPLNDFFNYCLSSTNGFSWIIFLVLLQTSRQNVDLELSEGFKMIFESYFEQLFTSASNVEEKAHLAEIILRGNTSDMEGHIAKYVELCKSLKDARSVCKLLKKIFDFSKKNKPAKLTDMVDKLLEILIEKCTDYYTFPRIMVPQLLIKLFDQGDFYATQIDKVLNHANFSPRLTSGSSQFLSFFDGLNGSPFLIAYKTIPGFKLLF